MNGVKQTFLGECKGTGASSNVTVHEFDYQGRTIPFPNEEKNKTAFGTSNLVNLTASTGQTLESIGQLVQVTQRHEHLDVVRTLVDEPLVDEPLAEDAQVEAMDYAAAAPAPADPTAPEDGRSWSFGSYVSRSHQYPAGQAASSVP